MKRKWYVVRDLTVQRLRKSRWARCDCHEQEWAACLCLGRLGRLFIRSSKNRVWLTATHNTSVVPLTASVCASLCVFWFACTTLWQRDNRENFSFLSAVCTRVGFIPQDLILLLQEYSKGRIIISDPLWYPSTLSLLLLLDFFTFTGVG